MIVADTGVIVALVDADDRHHGEVARLWKSSAHEWILPWAILPEVDYLLGAHVGEAAQELFLGDVADGRYRIEWGAGADLSRAREICLRYRALRLGLVDATVMATAERLRARAIATFDRRDFGAVALKGAQKLLP